MLEITLFLENLAISVEKTKIVICQTKLFNKIKKLQMNPAYSLYLNYQFLVPPENMGMGVYQGQARSQKKSSKVSSRKGSTDIDSKTKFKTQVCKYWKNGMQCPFRDNCNFAHGDQEIRTREFLPSKYKTRCCHKFNEEGYCPYGARCQFIHCDHKKPRVHHEEVLHCLSEQTGMFFSFLEEQQRNNGKCKRLNVFENLSEQKEGEMVYKMDEIIEGQDEGQNYVDVRSRHNSI